MKWYKATCSRCGMTLRRRTRTELLSAMRKHLWKFHRAWMIARIKAGRKEAGNPGSNNPHVLKLLQDLVTGDFIPGYKRYKRRHYEVLKPMLDKVAPFMPEPIQLAWKMVDRLADRIYSK